MKPTPLAAALIAATALAGAARAANVPPVLNGLTTGDLEVLVEGAGYTGGTYTDNQAAPISLFQYQAAGTAAASLTGYDVLPQAGSGAISGEYGSSSEGMLQLSGDGRSLTLMGYGVNAAAFNKNPTQYGTTTTGSKKTTALGQSGSLQGQGYTPVARVVAQIGANGSVESSTAVYGVFNGNNPRSAYTVDGSSFYISGQGTGSDSTGGVFYVQKGSGTASAVTGLDTSGKTLSQDTRDVQVYDGQLYVSVDSKGGSGSARDFVGTLGQSGALPTGVANSGDGPAMLPGYGNTGGTGKVVITAATTNGINTAGEMINLSPEQVFFADSETLYVADSGAPKNNSASTALGDGGLQKWSLVNGTWQLDYTVSAGLDLQPNSASAGSTGLFALAGKVVGQEVELYATNSTIGDTDPTFLYGLTDALAATTKASGESFTELAAAPADSNFKGLAFAPTSAAPEPASWSLMLVGIGAAGLMLRRRRPGGSAAAAA